jgi:hypothetical protein
MKGLLIACLFSFSLGILAQPSSIPDTSSNNLFYKAAGLAEELIDWVTWEQPGYTFSLYPMGGYSPRTGFEFGVMPVFSLPPSGDHTSPYWRPTTIAPSFSVSTKGMYDFQVDVLAFSAQQWLFISKVQYLYMPDTFYGIGNESKESPFVNYTLRQFTIHTDVLKGWHDTYFVGLRLDVNHHQRADFKEEEVRSVLPGADGGWTNGVGPVLAFDSRNSLTYPTSGWFLSAATTWFFHALGSDYGFSNTNIDIRKYFCIQEGDKVLAFQGYYNYTDGEVPFYKLSQVGGKRLLRGVPHPMKYIDRQSWYVQSEYRQTLWWRIGAAVFVGTGRVFPDFSDPVLKDLHVTFGGGLRFRVLPSEGLNFRADFGVTNRGDKALYFTIREAF